MSETLRERIITSETANRMLDRVSPIYDESYVGLWMFEAIGREYDRIWDILDELPQQLYPATTTWAIELWERRYGIVSDPTRPLEERRRLIKEFSAEPAPLNPYSLEKYLESVTGRRCVIVENIGPYTFGIYLYSKEDGTPTVIGDLYRYVNKHKQSHMSYELAIGVFETIHCGCQTGYWRYGYEYPGQHHAGEIPSTSTHYAHAGSNIHVHTDTPRYGIPYALAGTIPEPSWLGGVDGTHINIDGENQRYEMPYTQAGTIPDQSTLAAFGSGHIDVSSATAPFAFSHPLAGVTDTGTQPDTNTFAALSDGNINAAGQAEPYMFASTMAGDTNAGTRPETNTIGALDGSEIAAASEGKNYTYTHPQAGQTSAGAKPEFVVTGDTNDAPIEAAATTTSYSVSYSMCGTINTGA